MFPKISKPKKSIYLDYAAATPLDPLVKKTMEPFLYEKFGNPSSLYEKGREAKAALESARKTIANILNARPQEIVFTAGGTESVNAAIFGAARAGKKGSHLVASAIEHHCVINSFQALEEEGYKTTLVPVNKEGFIELEKLKKSIRKETVLVSVMYANNEVGTVQPILEVGKWLAQVNRERIGRGITPILFHTDACQAPGFLDLDVNRLGVDLLSLNGSKIYGPKQTGILYIRTGVDIKPLIYGGGQEKGRRSGTENVAGAVGLAKALQLVDGKRGKEPKRLVELCNYLVNKIKANIPNALLNGSEHFKLKDRIYRLPNNVNFSFKAIEGEALMLYLDSYGFEISTGSACSTSETISSHVLLALGLSEPEAQGSVRFSLGKFTTKKDLEKLLKILPPLVKELQTK